MHATFFKSHCFLVQRPTERMALFQLCINEENRVLNTNDEPIQIRENRRQGTCAVKSSCYYTIPKPLVTSNALLKSQARERMVDARIVERVQFTRPA